MYFWVTNYSEMLEDKIEKVLSILNERQKRLYLAMEAEEIGHGGVLIVSKASNVSRKTIIKGKKELHEFKKKDRTGIAGSNGYRIKLWKTELQKLANEIKMEITVCHFPPGTSKWNKIEHRLFCHITMNWKGIPLEDYETVVQLIGAVKTKGGLKVKALLDLNEYEKGKVVADEELKNISIKGHKFHPEWNYTIKPN